MINTQGGILSDYGGLAGQTKGDPLGHYSSQLGPVKAWSNSEPNRLPIPEDATRNLFQTLFENLVFASPEDRKRVLRMLATVYDTDFSF